MVNKKYAEIICIAGSGWINIGTFLAWDRDMFSKLYAFLGIL